MGEKAARLLWESVSVTGDGFFWFGLVPIGYMATKSWDPKSLLSMEARLIVSILVIDIGTIVVLKYLFRRERPPHHKKDFRFVGIPDTLQLTSLFETTFDPRPQTIGTGPRPQDLDHRPYSPTLSFLFDGPPVKHQKDVLISKSAEHS